MTKLTFFGVGPKIGIIALPYLTCSILLTLVFPDIFTFGEPTKSVFLIAGIILAAAGLIFYLVSARLLMGGLQNTRLVTTGPYRYCRNPLYAAIILLIIPGIGLIMNSWIILTTSIVGYLMFTRCIRGENDELDSFFGDEYRKYRKSTPEFFPFGPKDK